jgi:hypothetical protein
MLEAEYSMPLLTEYVSLGYTEDATKELVYPEGYTEEKDIEYPRDGYAVEAEALGVLSE